MTVQYWMPGPDDEKVAKFFDEGRPVIFSDMFQLYFDYPQAIIPVKKVHDYVPAINGRSCEDAPNTLGLEACLWTERVETKKRLEEQIFPRVFALAEAAWSREKDYDDFERRLTEKIEQLRKQDIYYTSELNPAGAERAKELKKIFAGFAGTEEEPDENKVNFVEMTGGDMVGDFIKRFGIEQQR